MPRLSVNQAPTTASITALEDRMDTVESDNATQGTNISNLQTDVSDAETSITAIQTDVSKTAKPITLAATNITGSGSDASTNLSLGFSPTTNNKYRINGVAIVRKQSNSAILCTVTFRDAVFLRDSGSTWAAVAGGSARISEKHADFASFFASDANVPILGDNGSSLCLYYNGIAVSPGFSIEFDGDSADFGA